jgi:hypothetical protein
MSHRLYASTSNSSKNNTHGAAALTRLKSILMDDSVCPKYLDNRSEERTETKFIFAFGEERLVSDEIRGRE